MNLSLRTFCRIIGLAMLVIGLSMFPSLIVAVIYKETVSFLAFLGTILFAAVCGFFLLWFGQPSTQHLKVRDGFLIVTVCWIVSALLGAAPFMLSGSIPDFFVAFFESCSGFSTTGATALSDVEILPKSILFWRSFTHWIGGMGILIFAIALMPSLGINGQNIAVSEAPGPTLDKITPKMSDTAKALYTTYFVFTIVETILLCLGGVSLYDSLLHTFGSVGTGGFFDYNNSVAHFDSVYAEMVITFFMILSGANFNLYYMSLKDGISSIFRDAEFRFYLFIIGASTILPEGPGGRHPAPRKAGGDAHPVCAAAVQGAGKDRLDRGRGFHRAACEGLKSLAQRLDCLGRKDHEDLGGRRVGKGERTALRHRGGGDKGELSRPDRERTSGGQAAADPGKEAYGRGRLPERLPGGAGGKAWRRRNGRINKKVLNLYEKQVGSLFFVYNTPLGG